MRVLARIWSEIKRGENIELYLTIIVASALVALDLVGVDVARFVPSLTLVVLALLALSILRSQHHLSSLGVHSIITYPNRQAISNLGEAITNAKNEVCILQTNLTAVLEFIVYLKEVKQSRHDLKIRILVLDPESKFIDARGYSLWAQHDGGGFRAESEGNFKGFINRIKRADLECEIRLYDELPSFVMYKMDSTLLVGFLPAGGYSRDRFHIELSEALPGVHETFIRHFRTVWERAKPCPVDTDAGRA